jgi:hypothetical protein
MDDTHFPIRAVIVAVFMVAVGVSILQVALAR